MIVTPVEESKLWLVDTFNQSIIKLGHNKLISCFLDRIQFRTGSVGRQKKKKKRFMLMNNIKNSTQFQCCRC